MSESAKNESQGAGQPPARKLVRVPADNFATYYVNNSEVGMTTWDLSIRFARIEGIEEDILRVQDQAVITMSLQHAKALAMILASYVKQYEKDNGKLYVPFGAIADTEATEEEIPTALYPPKGKK
jgi:hypothetical protein